jgi:gluconolactonase
VNLDAQPVKVAGGFKFCEGPAFDPKGRLWVVNLHGGFISRVTMSGKKTRVVDTPAPNGGQFDADGNYVCCECKKKAIVRVSPKGELSMVVESYDGRPFNGPNDIAIDADGGFYFTDPDGSSLENLIGAVYYVRPDRTVVQVDSGLAYPNGINITVDRSAVLAAETLTHRIYRYERRPDGTLGPHEVFCQLSGGVGPDGMCFDQDGNLYVAWYGSACIYVIAPSGKPIGRIPTPGDNPTNCCFGPPGSEYASSLFVTETVTNTVWRYDIGVPGMPLHHLAVASD